MRPTRPVRLVLMSSVSVHRPARLDNHRGAFERAFLWLLRALLPPARDNQLAADFLEEKIGAGHTFVQWAVVRPDTLLEGEVSAYTLYEGLVNELFAPGQTNFANVAHFMCELAIDPKAWADWQGKYPVIVNVAAAKGGEPESGPPAA